MRLIFCVIALLGALEYARCAKILAIFPFPGPSQYILVQPYLKTLAARGHEVTVINAFPQKEPIANFRDIPVLEIHRTYAEVIKDFINVHNRWDKLNFLSNFFTHVCTCALNDPNVQNLLQSKENFDLIIVETVLTDVLYGFAQHYNAPLIGVSSYGTDAIIDDLIGNVSPISYCPLVTSGLSDHMSFWQRLENLYLITLDYIHTYLKHLPHHVKLYKRYFPNATVDLLDLRKTFSLMLLNQHFSLSFPRPYVPNMVDVGGFHLNHQPKPLPADIDAFINASSNGVVYFSMGSNIQSKDLPTEKLNIILKTLAALQVNVLWKFEDAKLPGKPKNVFISKWFPQPDILAHANVKLFITHAGLLSTIESIYHAKPVVGLPIFYDQFLNMERVQKAGFGLGVDFSTLDVSTFRKTIEQVLYNASFTQAARKMSRLYHDQPMKPLDVAIFWTEYVLRHKGARHMQVAAQQLNFIQYHSIDTILVLFGGIALVLGLTLWLNYKLLKLIFGSKKSTENNKAKKQ